MPTYDKFVKLENTTLKLLHDRLSQLKILAHTAGFVKQCWNYNHQSLFRFGFHWNVPYMDKRCRLFLGADVRKQENGNYIANTSYCMCLVEGTDRPNKVLRKFHFDYVTARPDQRQAHPRFHLQYCGGFVPAMSALGVSEELMNDLLPDVSEPRIFFRPMTLALLMNIAFHEFPGGEIDEIRKRGEWRNLVRENEKVILRPFYSKCANLAGRDNAVFFDWVYV